MEQLITKCKRCGEVTLDTVTELCVSCGLVQFVMDVVELQKTIMEEKNGQAN